jgi:putative acetyltransferase
VEPENTAPAQGGEAIHFPTNASMSQSNEVQRIRQATRQIVRDLDFMKSSVLSTGCSASEIHTLFELEARGELAVSELAEILRQDKSTASRNVRSLVENGLVRKTTDPADGRAYRLSLTQAGQEKAADVNRMANSQVGDALALLDDDDRARAIQGIELYARALQRSCKLYRVEIRPIREADDAAMGSVIRSVMTEFHAVGAGYSIEDPEVDAMSESYSGPGTDYFVAERDGDILGGAGVGTLTGSDGTVCELRKMYVMPAGRGIGLGRKLLERCLEAARHSGYEQCYLETLRHMNQADRLYTKFGFKALNGPMGETGHFSCDSWSIKDL